MIQVLHGAYSSRAVKCRNWQCFQYVRQYLPYVLSNALFALNVRCNHLPQWSWVQPLFALEKFLVPDFKQWERSSHIQGSALNTSFSPSLSLLTSELPRAYTTPCNSRLVSNLLRPDLMVAWAHDIVFTPMRTIINVYAHVHRVVSVRIFATGGNFSTCIDLSCVVVWRW